MKSVVLPAGLCCCGSLPTIAVMLEPQRLFAYTLHCCTNTHVPHRTQTHAILMTVGKEHYAQLDASGVMLGVNYSAHACPYSQLGCTCLSQAVVTAGAVSL